MSLSAFGRLFGTLLLLAPLLVRGAPPEETRINRCPEFATALAVDHAGNVWMGSEDRGLARLAPDGAVETFTHADGLGDDGSYALAVDQRGRLWVGHHNHGVSVLSSNGQEWKNYSPADGPLGEHVYAIAVSPKSGDVWIATDAGLTRWSQAHDTWSTFTRAEGVPGDQFRGIAFDSDGDIYLASAASGVVIGRAAEDFGKWEQVKGVDEMPLVVRGKGLPTNLTNAVCVTKTNAIWVATTRGLATSSDKGKTWKYTRGSDWAQKVEGSYAGAPPGYTLKGETQLAEDYVNTVATDSTGDIWVGFRAKGWQRLAANVWPVQAVLTQFDPNPPGDRNDEVVALLTTAGKTAYVARYGMGVFRCDRAAAAIAAAPLVKADAAPLPTPAAPLKAEALAQLKARLAKMGPAGINAAAYLGEDWSTRGDWVGRYGRQYGSLSGVGMGTHSYGELQRYFVDYSVGPHHPNAGVYSYVHEVKAKSLNVLWDPIANSRTQGEHNDGSFSLKNFPLAVEGPDLWVSVRVPEGAHRIALYFYNVDGHRGINAWRDYPLELRRAPDAANAAADDDEPPVRGRRGDESRFALEKQPVLARGRVTRFTGGVYEQFLVSGKGQYWIKIVRNHSACTKIQGVFIDRLSPDRRPASERGLPGHFAGVEWPVPALPAAAANAPASELAARELWQALDESWEREGIEKVAYHFRTLAYRAVAAKLPESRLEAFRWPLHLWTPEDRDTFAAKMAEGFAKFKALNPQIDRD